MKHLRNGKTSIEKEEESVEKNESASSLARIARIQERSTSLLSSALNVNAASCETSLISKTERPGSIMNNILSSSRGALNMSSSRNIMRAMNAHSSEKSIRSVSQRRRELLNFEAIYINEMK